MSERHRLIIDEAGGLRAVYDDALSPLLAALGRRGGGSAATCRASHVEPIPRCATPRWSVDLSPVGGPYFAPFFSRGDALAFERRWLEERLGTLDLDVSAAERGKNASMPQTAGGAA